MSREAKVCIYVFDEYIYGDIADLEHAGSLSGDLLIQVVHYSGC